MSLTYTVDTSRLEARLAAARHDLEHDLMRATWVATDRGYDAARSAVPVQSGRLRRAIRKRTSTTNGGGRGEVRVSTAQAPHARSIDEGSKPHVITAKNAPVLRFQGRSGGWVSKKSVNHPGTKAQPFMAPAAEVMRSVLRRNTDAAVARFCSRFRSR